MNKKLIVPKDYPFREEVERFLKQTTISRSSDTGIIANEEVTVTRKIVIHGGIGGLFTKLFRNKELLHDLSPAGAKLLINIMLDVDHNDVVVKLTQKDSGMGRKVYEHAMLELLMKRIIIKKAQPYYWVNVTVLLMGVLDDNQDTIKY